MVTFCVGCQTVLEDDGKDDGLRSHSICRKCAGEQLMSSKPTIYKSRAARDSRLSGCPAETGDERLC